jgi:hypothetical protein
VFAAVVGVLYGFGRTAHDSGRSVELQHTARSVTARMVMDLRQAQAVSVDGFPIESLEPGQLVFYTDRLSDEGPERVVYERADCRDGMCELRVVRYPAMPGTGPAWRFRDAPIAEGTVLVGLHGDRPLFRGVVWSGDPRTKHYVASCGPTGRACDFTLVSLLLTASPVGASQDAGRPLEIEEEVRLRNG